VTRKPQVPEFNYTVKLTVRDEAAGKTIRIKLRVRALDEKLARQRALQASPAGTRLLYVKVVPNAKTRRRNLGDGEGMSRRVVPEALGGPVPLDASRSSRQGERTEGWSNSVHAMQGGLPGLGKRR
jgi:hypothetical protein